jgi:hypothetical protein
MVISIDMFPVTSLPRRNSHRGYRGQHRSAVHGGSANGGFQEVLPRVQLKVRDMFPHRNSPSVLFSMGFDDAQVHSALARSGGNEERAVDLLLSNHAPSSENPAFLPHTPLLISLDRVQSQVFDANIGARSLNSLFGMLDLVHVVSLETALLGDGSGEPCLLNMDIAVVGVSSKPTRAQLVAMINWARSMAKDSIAASILPTTLHGISTIDLLAAVFLYTAENPYPLYYCITVPLNVSGARSLQSLLHQLPFFKLLSLGLRCLPQDGPYYFEGAMYRGVDIKKNPSFKAKYDTYATAYQVGTTITFAAPTSFSISDHAAGAFCNGIQFVVPVGAGTKLHDLSAFDGEGEVVVDGPSSWEVTASTMTPTGTLVVILKRAPTALVYLTRHDDELVNTSPPAVSPVSRPVALEHVHAHAAPGPSPLLILSAKQVALLVQSVKPEFSKYAGAIAQHDCTGVFLAEATDEELSDMFKDMKVATAHRVDLRKAVAAWKADPQEALQAIKREKQKIKAEKERLAAAAQAAAAARQRQEREQRQAEAEKIAEAERQRQAERKRLAAAERAKILADPMCVVHENHAYKTLFGSHPNCTVISHKWPSYATLDNLPGWKLCPKTPEALHVCASHQWGSSALIFADGTAHYCGRGGQVANPSHIPEYRYGAFNWLLEVDPSKGYGNRPGPNMGYGTRLSNSPHYGFYSQSQGTEFSAGWTMDYLLCIKLPE